MRANFIEGRLDHRRTFTEFNERVIAPFEKGWFGALIKGKDPLKPDEQTSPAVDRGGLPRHRRGRCRASRRATSSSRSTAAGDADRTARGEARSATTGPRQRGHARDQARGRPGGP